MLRMIVVGLLMGAAEVVPGVSGGTIAFISGFYERLVNGLQRLTPMALLTLPREGIVAWWRRLDLNFLLLLFGAMFVSILVLARGVSHLLETQPIMIWSFFFGLILASVVVVSHRVMPLTWDTAASISLGILIGVVVTRLVPVEVEISGPALFIGGCIAVCAWILPGLSGSFILLVLGLYHAVIGAVRDLDFLTLAWVAAGCIVGLMSFSRILAALLRNFHDATVALLAGFMVGSLVKIWPWKHTTSYQIKTDGGQIPVVQEPVSPLAYEQLTGNEPQVMLAIAACVAGIGVIVVMHALALITDDENERTTAKS